MNRARANCSPIHFVSANREFQVLPKMSKSEEVESLFSYGTLQDEEVQLATFGRTLTGEKDALPAYSQSTFGPHLNIEFTGEESDFVAGTNFLVSRAELKDADEYEATADYQRVRVQLKSGRLAWVYLHDAD